MRESEWVSEWASLGVSVGIRKWDSFWCSHLQEVKDAVSSSLWLKLVMWAQLPRHRFGLHSICTAQLARLLEEPAVEGQPAGLEIKHTCSSLLPSGTFFGKRDHLFFNKHWAPLWEYIMQDWRKATIHRGKLVEHYSRQKESCICQFILVLYPLSLLRHP